MNTVKEIVAHLDDLITYWRGQRESEDPLRKCVAPIYLNAYQNLRKDITGATLPTEPGTKPDSPSTAYIARSNELHSMLNGELRTICEENKINIGLGGKARWPSYRMVEAILRNEGLSD